MGSSLGRSVTIKACAAALVLSLPVAGGVAWADGADVVAGSGKAAAFAAETGVLSGAELSEIGIAVASDVEPIVDWDSWGTCEWMIDNAGCLIVRPTNGSAEGHTALGIPWSSMKPYIKAVRFEGTCRVDAEWGSCIDCRNWFNGCSELKEADVTGLDTSKVEDMSLMFAGCSSLVSLDLSGWDTSKVTGMEHMFAGCSSLSSVGDLSGWDTSSVTDMGRMFYDCAKLETVGDLSGWDTSSVTDMNRIFYGCSSLAWLNLSGWDTSNVTYMHSEFSDCTSLVTLDLSGWDTSKVTNMCGMFDGCESLKSIKGISDWDTSSVTDMSAMFQACSSLELGDSISGWDVSSVENMVCMFINCTSLDALDLSGWDTSNATELGWMFKDCSSLATVGDLSGWDTSKVTDMSRVFEGCESLKTVGDLSGWDTSNVTDMSGMFNCCSKLVSLDLSGWDTSKVENMGFVFSNCFGLTSVNLSGWDTSKVENMELMFYNCLSLRTAVLGEKFSFMGAGNELLWCLPTPIGNGLTGKWVSSADGKAYSPSDIPNNVAATYTAERTGAPDPEPEPTPDPVPTFPDVDYSQWYADGVTFCAEKGLITGYTDGEDAGKFGVGRTLTRAQLAAILWRNAEPEAAEAYDGNAVNATGMGDVADNEWYTGAANWAVANEVVNGFGGTEFRPNDPVTAEQLATILANYADRAGAEAAEQGALDSFADSDAISDWARGSVAWAKSKDIINGYEENGVRLLKPQEEIARERVATILMNAFESGVLK